MGVDWAVISDLEGGSLLEGYVPLGIELVRPGRSKGNWQYYGDVEPTARIRSNVKGASGVTIGTGVDLGSKTAALLNALGGDLPRKLGPFLGLTRAAAIDKLWETRGVRITRDEAGRIDEWAFSAYANSVKTRFDADARGPSWHQLSSGVQTALTSIHYNWGVVWNHPESKPQRKVWNHVTRGQWWQAYVVWSDFAESLPAGESWKRLRTRKEANLLRPSSIEIDDESADQL